MNNTLVVNTETAAVLYRTEVVGQLSDGMWENTKPEDHWVFWAHTEPMVSATEPKTVVYAPSKGPMKNGYRLGALVAVIGDVLVERMQKHFPGYTEKQLVADLRNIHRAMKNVVVA